LRGSVEKGSDTVRAFNGLERGSGMKRGRKIQQSFLKLHVVIHHELPWVSQRRDVVVE